MMILLSTMYLMKHDDTLIYHVFDETWWYSYLPCIWNMMMTV